MIHIKIILLLSLAAYVACGGGKEPPTIDGIPLKFPDDDDNKPITENNDDEFYDAVTTPPKSPEQEPIKSNFQDRGVGSSGSSSSTKQGPTINYGYPGSIQCNNSGVIYGAVTVNVKGKRLVVDGDTLFFDGQPAEGVNARERPLRLVWGEGKLKVNGKIVKNIKGIKGSGTWDF